MAMISAFTVRSVKQVAGSQLTGSEGWAPKPSGVYTKLNPESSVVLRSRLPTSGYRFLLRHAVHRSKAPDQVSRVNRNDFAGGKLRCQNVECHSIVGIVEHRNQK